MPRIYEIVEVNKLSLKSSNLNQNKVRSLNWELTHIMHILIISLVCTAVAADSLGLDYHILGTSHSALSSSSQLTLKFLPVGRHHRVRRQSEPDGSKADSRGFINADTATAFVTGGHAAPDEASQPTSLSSEVVQNVTHANSTLVLSATTTAATTVANGSNQAIRIMEDMETSSQGQNPFDEADEIHDLHDYYTSSVLQNKLAEHWVDLQNASRHDTLSSGHRVATVIKLNFNFYFYGHKVTNVTVATGGFIYMSPFLHQWLTATQYIAPLMANFDPSLSKDSGIYYLSEDNRFVVEWKNILLKDQPARGKFHFQTVLRDDGSIKFVYKSIPLPISNISTEEHPVKVGVSDAYYNDTFVPEFNIKRRTIYEYHKVAVPKSSVTSGSVVILSPLPTCNRLLDCQSCVNHVEVKFDCRWCNNIGICSDGLDWYRQHWDKEGCPNMSTMTSEECAALPPPPKKVTNPMHYEPVKNSCSDGQCDKKSELPTAVIVVVVLVVCGLLTALLGWLVYAYKNPTSRSGLWLLEHRPSQLRAKMKFWRSVSNGAAKYKVESEA